MQSSATDSDAQRIRALDEAWAAAAARRDLDGMLVICAPDAQELLPGYPAIVGRGAIRQLYPATAHAFGPVGHRP